MRLLAELTCLRLDPVTEFCTQDQFIREEYCH
jgi:hypothetical protein